MATLIYGTSNVDDTFTEDERVPKRAQKCGGDSTPPLLKIAKVCILQKCHVYDYQLFCQTKENKPPFSKGENLELKYEKDTQFLWKSN